MKFCLYIMQNCQIIVKYKIIDQIECFGGFPSTFRIVFNSRKIQNIKLSLRGLWRICGVETHIGYTKRKSD